MDLESPEGRKWLRSAEGRQWLPSDEGLAWLYSPTGMEWQETRDGREWFEERVQEGWVDYFAGRMRPAPEWAMKPESAPRIGLRVRLTRDQRTGSGVEFHAGELGIIDELRLGPMGVVSASIRTLDGRTLLTTMPDTFEPA